MPISLLSYEQTNWLRIQLKALAAESRAIRHAERHQLFRIARKLKGVYSKKHQKNQTPPAPPKTFKLPDNAESLIDAAYAEYWGLHRFRVHDVRKEARAVHLAYNFLRGKDYQEAEASGAYEPPKFDRIWNHILENTNEFTGDNERKALVDDFEKWKTKALIHLGNSSESGDESLACG